MCLVCKRDNIWLPLQTTKAPLFFAQTGGVQALKALCFQFTDYTNGSPDRALNLTTVCFACPVYTGKLLSALRYTNDPQSQQGRDSHPVMKTLSFISTEFVTRYCLRPKPAQPELAVKSPSI